MLENKIVDGGRSKGKRGEINKGECGELREDSKENKAWLINILWSSRSISQEHRNTNITFSTFPQTGRWSILWMLQEILLGGLESTFPMCLDLILFLNTKKISLTSSRVSGGFQLLSGDCAPLQLAAGFDYSCTGQLEWGHHCRTQQL